MTAKPEVHVIRKGKRWFRECSACGPLDGFNTSESHAQERADLHMAEEHEGAK